MSRIAPVVANVRNFRVVEVAMRADTYVYIGRPSGWGNPYTWKVSPSLPTWVPDRAAAIARYEGDLRRRLAHGDEALRDQILALEGKVLGCFCAPNACHGDTLVKLWMELTTP